LSGAGDGDSLPSPSESYVATTSGQHLGCLRGPIGADFNLALKKLGANGAWVTVAQSAGLTANEDVSYSGTPGSYRWRVTSRSGMGTYTFGLTRPG
jgi:hypothetical protein